MHKLLGVLHKKNLSRYILCRLLLLTGLCRFFIIHSRGCRFRFSRCTIASELWMDPESRDCGFEPFLEKGDVVADVGSNIGTTVIPSAKKVGETGKVYAIEANPRIYGYLVDNISLNGLSNVTPLNLIAGPKAGMAEISDLKFDDRNRVVEGSSCGISVQMDSLDNMLKDEPLIALLKVDVEGYEKNVLDGSAETLKRTECVYVELSEDMYREYGHSIRDVISILAGAGFKVFRFAPVKTLSEIDPSFVQSASYEDVIAVKDPARLLKAGFRLAPE